MIELPLPQIVFLIIAALSIFAAFNVILQRNPLYSALSLIVTLCSMAGLFLMLEAQFVAAVTQGTSPEGEHLFPAFPYTSFQRMKRDDVRDLFAYIKSLPPVPGRAHENAVPFPLNIRRMIGGWKLLYLDGKPFEPNPAMSAGWNRGAYLVNGPGHCAECHSVRNGLGAIVSGKRFAGNPNIFGQLGFPNITQSNLKKWSQDDFANLLETGLTADGGRVGGPMAEVVRGTAQLSDQDRAAMAEYLKSLPPTVGASLK